MNSLTAKFAIGFIGRAIGTSANPSLKTEMGRASRLSVTGDGYQVYDTHEYQIPVNGTLTLDLTTGLTNPLGESISGTVPFQRVQGVWIEHSPTSLATSGITAFGGGTTEFQGFKAAGDKDTLLPGRWTAMGTTADDAGINVTTSEKTIAIVNLDSLYVADVSILIIGLAGTIGNSVPFRNNNHGRSVVGHDRARRRTPGAGSRGYVGNIGVVRR